MCVCVCVCVCSACVRACVRGSGVRCRQPVSSADIVYGFICVTRRITFNIYFMYLLLFLSVLVGRSVVIYLISIKRPASSQYQRSMDHRCY